MDAFHWVTTPNVVAMGSFATDVLSSKPYAASANYVNEMSDYCSSCVYAHTKTTGDRACPFNALYWDFLERNEETLRSNDRMGLMYSDVDNIASRYSGRYANGPQKSVNGDQRRTLSAAISMGNRRRLPTRLRPQRRSPAAVHLVRVNCGVDSAGPRRRRNDHVRIPSTAASRPCEAAG